MFAIRSTRPVDRLVIMNVPHPRCMERELRTLRQLRRSWYVFFFQLPRLPEWALTRNDAAPVAAAFTGMAVDETRFPPEVTDVFREAAQRPGAMRTMVNYYRAAFRGSFRGRKEQLPVIDTPTLVLWGLEDTALGRETTDGTDEWVSDLTLRFLPGVSHWVQQEAPEIVNEMLLAFLDDESVPEADTLTPARLRDPALGS
jgi:pimeloyl-ACP methyl ester carboxylesterase